MQVKTYPSIGSIGVTPTYGAWYDRIIGRIIRWGTGTKDQYGKFHDSKVNHAVIYIGYVDDHPNAKPQLVQAQPGGAALADWDSYGDNMIWIDSPHRLNKFNSLDALSLTDNQRMLIAAAALVCATKKVGYNYLDLLVVGLAQKRFHKLIDPQHLKIWDRWIVKRLSRPDRMICSQLVDYCYATAGVSLFEDGRPYGLVSPADLLGLL